MRPRLWWIGPVVVAAAALALGSTATNAQQPMGQIRIVSPTNGSTVTGPVRLQVEIAGVRVRPAAEGDPNAFHYHALVDVDPATVLQTGQPIPTGEANIIHTADLTLELAPMSPGQHTVTVVLTRTDHVPLTPSIQDRVTFTVAAPAAPPAPAAAPAPAAEPAAAAPAAAPAPQASALPRAGAGGVVLADSLVTSATLLPVIAGVVAGAVAALVARRRQARRYQP